jgi:class 3 adenylate cyclase/tetratricopeptide (TPR) repeat protein
VNPYWQPYIPGPIAADIVAHPERSPVGRELRFPAVALFADISGFTALSEALGQTGSSGTEELTSIVNNYFGPMIALIHSYSGVIGGFGGDGMTVLFPYTPRNRQAVVRRAIQCALDMQAAMPHYAAIRTRAGVFGMGMQAGLAMGEVLCTTVGDPALRLMPVIAGSAVDRCAEAERYAGRGEVVVHTALLPYAGAVATGAARDEFTVVTRLERPALPRIAMPPPAVPSPAIQPTLQAYLHPAIAARLRHGQTGFINEYRAVTMLFAGFSGFDYDHDPAVVAKLQNYFTAVTRIVARYDGYLNKIDIGDKGSTYLVLFGAPLAHENDPERALRCAAELQALPGVPTHMGLNTGLVYCGNVGAAARQEYTVIGGAVNLATRLMQVAGSGQILLTDFTRRLVPDSIQCEELPPIGVKGLAEPVPISALIGLDGRAPLRLQGQTYTLPMVGREVEKALVAAKLSEVLDGAGQIIGITAEAGMGKSRLNSEIWRLAGQDGLQCYAGECQSYGTNVPYLVWQNLLRGFFGVDPTASDDAQIRTLTAAVEQIDPAAVPRLPLLGVALNMPIAETEITRSPDAKLRKAALEAMLIHAIRARAQDRPLLLVLEDCQWIDPLSLDLLEAVARNIGDVPVLVVLVYRTLPQPATEGERLTALPYFTELRLAEFTRAEAERLIRMKVARLFGTEDDVPLALIRRITERAQGNPFYIDEMINLIHDQGIDPTDLEALQHLDLPASLRSLIISRIDQLPEGEKTTLKVASVIGRVFPAAWIWGCYPQLGPHEQVLRYLSTLSQMDLTHIDQPEPELIYLFKHIVTQEVAYQSLAGATRAKLHGQIGAFLEQTYGDDIQRWITLLAHHYSLSGDVAKQREYFLRAAEAAQAAYANDAAIEYYRRLVPLLPRAEQTAVRLKIGGILQLIGQWSEAEELYRRALQKFETARDPYTRARLQQALGDLLGLKGSYGEALLWLQRARKTCGEIDDRQGVARAIGGIGHIYWRQGNYADALACAEQQLAAATEIGDQEQVSQALGNFGRIYWEQGEYARALAGYSRQLQIATALGDRPSMILALGSMGNVYWQQGEYAAALACFEQSLLRAVEIDDRRGISITVGQMGTVYWRQGNYAQALACFGRQLGIATEMGERRGVSEALGNMGIVYGEYGDYRRSLVCLQQQLAMAGKTGDRKYMSIAVANMARAYTAQGRYAEADRLYAQAVELADLLNNPYLRCEYLHGQAALYALLGRAADAQALNDVALRQAVAVQRRDIQFQAEVLAIRLGITLQQISPATALAALHHMESSWPAPEQRAALRYEGWRIDPSRHDLRENAAAEYRALYAALPQIEYRQRYQELTGRRLPSPPPLPDLPPAAARESIDPARLLDRVDATLAQMAAAQAS